MSKRIVALLLALIMVFAMTACGAKEVASSMPEEAPVSEATAAEPETVPEEVPAEPEAEAPAEASVAEEVPEEPAIVINYPIFDEPTTFTIWSSNSPDLSEIISDMNQYLVFEELEKVTNVKWDATLVSFFAASEQFTLMLAAEDYRDVVVRATDYYTYGVDQAIEEEFLIDLGPYIDENMPNLLGWFETYPDLRAGLSSVEGAIGGFPKIYLEKSDVTSGGCLRLDWLEDLGLEEPKTYDDLYNILKEFKEKKGASEPLVISVPTGVQSELLNGYNIGAGAYHVGDEVRFGAVQPEFKEYLTMLNKWYSEGLVDDLFLSQQSENLFDVSPVLNGTCGVWYGTAAQSMTNILSQSTDPNMRITGITNITVDGSVAHLGEEGSVYDSTMWSITPVCEDPAAICQYLDYIYGEDGILLANYGVEGETFNYDENGNPVLTELVTNNPDFTYSLALNVYCCDRQTPIPFVIDETKARNDYNEDQRNSIAVWNEATDGLYNMPKIGMNMTADETEEYNAVYSDIDTYLDENISKFIVGDKSLDEFDAFVDTLYEMGIQECIDITQGAYDRYLAG